MPRITKLIEPNDRKLSKDEFLKKYRKKIWLPVLALYLIPGICFLAYLFIPVAEKVAFLFGIIGIFSSIFMTIISLLDKSPEDYWNEHFKNTLLLQEYNSDNKVFSKKYLGSNNKMKIKVVEQGLKDGKFLTDIIKEINNSDDTFEED